MKQEFTTTGCTHEISFNNVLVIDADPICHVLITKYNGITCFADHLTIVDTGQEGLLELLACYAGVHYFPDVIFLDINMPQMNGWEFLKEYARLPQKSLRYTTIIMLTSSNAWIDIERANKNHQIYQYMEKPVTIEKLELLRATLIPHPKAA